MECSLAPASINRAAPSQLLQVLPQYLDFGSLLTSRLVCKTWSNAFGAHVQKLRVSWPESADAATAAGCQAAAFANARLSEVDLQQDSCQETVVALLQPFSKLHSLQELRLRLPSTADPCLCLPAALPLLPQLQVLDLSQCRHSSCDLLIIAQHLKQLQQLLLHCPAFTTLSGRVVGRSSVYWAWEHVGGIVPYQPQHMAALAQLPCLRVLECTVPTVCQPEHQVKWLAAVATLTQLTALHIIQGNHHPNWPLSARQLSQLSSLTALRNLSTDAGAPADVHWADRGLPGEAERQAQAQAQQWGIVLAGMQHLTRLELVQVLLCDELLKTIGSTAPQLRELSFDVATKH